MRRIQRYKAEGDPAKMNIFNCQRLWGDPEMDYESMKFLRQNEALFRPRVFGRQSVWGDPEVDYPFEYVREGSQEGIKQRVDAWWEAMCRLKEVGVFTSRDLKELEWAIKTLGWQYERAPWEELGWRQIQMMRYRARWIIKKEKELWLPRVEAKRVRKLQGLVRKLRGALNRASDRPERLRDLESEIRRM